MAIAITPVLTAANTTAPADGFCVFFWDSEYKLIPKGYGDSLGYTNYYGVLFRSHLELREVILNKEKVVQK